MKIFFTFILLSITFGTKCQTATVKGFDILYFISDDSANYHRYYWKYDSGSQVHLIDVGLAPFLNILTFDSLRNAINCLRSYNGYREIVLDADSFFYRYEKQFGDKKKKKYKRDYENRQKNYDQWVRSRDENFEELKSYGAETKEKFDALCDRAYKMKSQITRASLPMSMVDASGSFSIITKPGDYYLYVASNHKKETDCRDFLLTIDLRKISLKDGDVKEVHYQAAEIKW